MAVRRVDSAVRLDGVKRTPQGGLRVEAALARTGILLYRQPDGSVVREYVPAEELARKDSLESLSAAPVTKLHPPEMVSRKNWSKYARGTVGENVRVDGDKIVATVYLQDADLADAVERGDMREVSCGYVCDLVNAPGVTPTGERYDRMQTNRRYNHAAIVPVGRAGSEVALRLDADDNVIDEGEDEMKIEKIDGVEYEIGTDAHKAACERRDAAEKARAEEIATLKAEVATVKADAAREKSRADALEAAEKTRKDAADRAALEAQSKPLLGVDFKFDGKSNAEIMTAVVAKAFPEEKCDASELGAFYKAGVRVLAKRTDEAANSLGNLNAALLDRARSDAANGAGKIDIDRLRTDMVARLNGTPKA